MADDERTDDQEEPTVEVEMETAGGEVLSTTYFTSDEVQHADATQYHLHGAFAYALIVEKGPRAGMAFVLAAGKTTIGRDPECSIFLDDITVSRRHATVNVDASGISIEDRGSTNGTFVAGQSIVTSDLRAGNEIVLGKFHLLVVEGDG